MRLWQRLEENAIDLAGESNVAPNQLNKIIKKLQNQFQITNLLPAEHIATMIIGCIVAVILSGHSIVEEKEKLSYIKNMIDLITNLLKARNTI